MNSYIYLAKLYSYVPDLYAFWNHTVDGRNPAPVDMVNISEFTGNFTSQVVQDFFQQQYVTKQKRRFTRYTCPPPDTPKRKTIIQETMTSCPGGKTAKRSHGSWKRLRISYGKPEISGRKSKKFLEYSKLYIIPTMDGDSDFFWEVIIQRWSLKNNNVQYERLLRSIFLSLRGFTGPLQLSYYVVTGQNYQKGLITIVWLVLKASILRCQNDFDQLPCTYYIYYLMLIPYHFFQ